MKKVLYILILVIIAISSCERKPLIPQYYFECTYWTMRHSGTITVEAYTEFAAMQETFRLYPDPGNIRNEYIRIVCDKGSVAPN